MSQADTTITPGERSGGRRPSRRRALAFFGVSALNSVAEAATLARSEALDAAAPPHCLAIPVRIGAAATADAGPERDDLRIDAATGAIQPGAPLALRFELSRVTEDGGSAALPGVNVEIWHCDAAGANSGVEARRNGGIDPLFLRGRQRSGPDGVVRFATVYPGWHAGRAVHAHVRIRVPAAAGLIDEFTSPLYFNDELSDRVHARQPYAAHRGQRLLNWRDMIFRETAAPLVLPVAGIADGAYEAAFRIALRLDAPRG